jgi:hypothetical protein
MDLKQAKEICVAHTKCTCKAESPAVIKKYPDKTCPFRLDPVGCGFMDYPCFWDVDVMMIKVSLGNKQAKPTT